MAGHKGDIFRDPYVLVPFVYALILEVLGDENGKKWRDWLHDYMATEQLPSGAPESEDGEESRPLLVGKKVVDEDLPEALQGMTAPSWFDSEDSIPQAGKSGTMMVPEG